MAFFSPLSIVGAAMQIAIVVYCLYLKLGVSSLIGSAVTIIVMLPLQFFVGREMSRNSEHGAVSLTNIFCPCDHYNVFNRPLKLFSQIPLGASHKKFSFCHHSFVTLL
jgi:hypothetical protein